MRYSFVCVDEHGTNIRFCHGYRDSPDDLGCVEDGVIAQRVFILVGQKEMATSPTSGLQQCGCDKLNVYGLSLLQLRIKIWIQEEMMDGRSSPRHKLQQLYHEFC